MLDKFDNIVAEAAQSAPRTAAILNGADYMNDEDYPHVIYEELADLAVQMERELADAESQRAHIVDEAREDGRLYREEIRALTVYAEQLKAALTLAEPVILDIFACRPVDGDVALRALTAIDAALAKNPNPSGLFAAEASGNASPEASGPVGLGPDVTPARSGETWSCPASHSGCQHRERCRAQGWCQVAGSIERIDVKPGVGVDSRESRLLEALDSCHTFEPHRVGDCFACTVRAEFLPPYSTEAK